MGRRHIFQQKFEFSTFRLPGPTSNKRNCKGGDVCVFIHENLSLKLREDPRINCEAIQSLSIEISSSKSKNIVLNTIYRPPNGDMKQCQTYVKDVFSKNGKNRKHIVLAGDVNINFRF